MMTVKLVKWIAAVWFTVSSLLFIVGTGTWIADCGVEMPFDYSLLLAPGLGGIVMFFMFWIWFVFIINWLGWLSTPTQNFDEAVERRAKEIHVEVKRKEARHS